MRLYELTIRGFRSHRRELVVPFHRFRAGVLTGHNGAGKSTIPWAIRWVMTGECPSSNPEEVITDGEDTAYVSLKFTARDGNLYDVQRQLTRGGSTIANLFRRDDTAPGGWAAETKKKIRETEAALGRVIGCPPALALRCGILDARVPGFGRMNRTERRVHLNAILDAKVWVEAAQEAGRRARSARDAARGIMGEIAGPRFATLEADRDACDRAIAHAVADRADLDGALVNARAAVEAAGAAVDRAVDASSQAAVVDGRRSEVQAALTRARADRDRADGDVERAEAARERLTAIERIASTMFDLNRAMDAANDALVAGEAQAAQLRAATDEVTALERAYVDAAQRASNLERTATTRATAITGAGFAADVHVASALATLEARRVALVAEQGAHREAIHAGAAAEDDARRLVSARAGIDLAIRHAAEAHNLLGRVPCTKAASWMAATTTDRDGNAAPEGDCDLAGTCPLLADARDRVGKGTEAQAAVEANEAERARLDALVAAARDARDAHHRAASEIEEIGRRSHALRTLPEAPPQAALDAVRAEVARIVEEGKAARARQAAIAPVEVGALHRAATDARVNVERAQERLKGADDARAVAATLDDAKARHADAVLRVDTLAVQAASFVDVPSVAEAGRRLAAARDDRAQAEAALAHMNERRIPAAVEAHQRAIAARAELDDRLAQHAEKMAAYTAHVDDAVGWEAAADAARAAPAVLVDTFASPTIEHNANALLARVSQTGMSITILTQRAKKDGEGVAETMDIMVRDDQGQRLIENYSGGELFNTDIGLALGEGAVMANAATAPVDWLIIDEGWGALDGVHLPALRNVIAGLASMYSNLLIMTHIPAVAEALPTQLYMERVGDTSRLTMTNL